MIGIENTVRPTQNSQSLLNDPPSHVIKSNNFYQQWLMNTTFIINYELTNIEILHILNKVSTINYWFFWVMKYYGKKELAEKKIYGFLSERVDLFY
jgi:hypothetical protein